MNTGKNEKRSLGRFVTLAVAVAVTASAAAQRNPYKAKDDGYYVNLMESNSGLVATSNRTNEIVLIKNGVAKSMVNTRNCGMYMQMSKDKRLIGYKSITDDCSKQAPALLNVETGVVTLLEDYTDECGQVSFSDNGTMAYTMGNNLVIRYGDTRKVFDLGFYVNIVNISPDATKVAFTTIDGVSYLFDIATGTKSIVNIQGNAPYNPIWSPDGTKIAYQKIDGTLSVMDVASRANYYIGEAASVSWTSDSKELVFTRADREDEIFVNSSSVLKASYDGRSIQTLVSSNADTPVSVAQTLDGGYAVSYALGNLRGIYKMASVGNVSMKKSSNQSILACKGEASIGTAFERIEDKKIPTGTPTSTKPGLMREGSIGILDIPYINQVWDTPPDHYGCRDYGYICCAPSSSCMLLGYYNLLNKYAFTSYASGVGTVYYSWYVGRDYTSPKTGYTFNKRKSANRGWYGCSSSSVGGGYGYMWGNGSPASTMHNFYKNNGMADAYFSSSWSKFVSECTNNRPYTICLQNNTSGHVVLGFRTNCYVNSSGAYVSRTGCFVCHDPYGDYNRKAISGGSYPNWDGRYSSYDWPGYNSGHANINTFYWGCVAIPPASAVKNPTITVSPASLNFECYQNEHPSLSFSVTGKDLDNNITVASITPGRFSPSVTSLPASGGKVTVTFNISDAIGTYGPGGTAVDYNFYIKVVSGSVSKTIPITATVKAPPMNLVEKWNLSEQKSTKTSKGWDAGLVRNFCYANGKLYCVYNHSDIKVINAQTGEDLGNLNLGSAVSGGTLKLCDVKYIDGHIVACNLAASGLELRLYAWDDDQSDAYLLYSTTDLLGASRLGDCMELSGSWNDLWVSFANTNTETRIIEFHRDSAGSWSSRYTKATTDGTTDLKAGATSRAYRQTSGWWVDGKDIYPSWCTPNSSGVAVRQCNVSTLGETWGACHHEFNFNGLKYAANLKFTDRVSGDNTSTYKGGRMNILIDNTGNFSTVTQVGEYPSGGLGSTSRNMNVTGDVMINTDGSTYVEAWVCSTTQGMAYYCHGTAPTQNPSPIVPTTSDPSISVDAKSVALSCEAYSKATKTVKISGKNLEGDITLALSGANADQFQLSQTSIAKATGSADVTITYAPTVAGSHTATLTASSANAANVTVSLSGTASVKLDFDDNIVLSEVWNYSQTKGNLASATWFSADAPRSRDIAYANGKLYVLNSTPFVSSPVITILNAYTGAKLGTLKTDDIAAGENITASIKALGGKILVSNSARIGADDGSSYGDAFKVYIWDDDTSAPRTLLEDPSHENIYVGTIMSVYGNLTSGKLLFSDGSKIVIYTITNGAASTTPTVITLTTSTGAAYSVGTQKGSVDVQLMADGTYWVTGKDVPPTHFDASGKYMEQVSSTLVQQAGNSTRFFDFGEKKYMASATYLNKTEGVTITDGAMALLNITNGITDAPVAIYPADGLGTERNIDFATGVEVSVRENKIVDAWIIVEYQGIAYYTYNGEKESAVEGVETNSMQVLYAGNIIRVLGTPAKRISLYSLSGALVADAQGTSEMSTSLLVDGVYIVKVTDITGQTKTLKIVKR